MLARTTIILGCAFMALAFLAHRMQVGCPGLANPGVAQGWDHLANGEVDRARDAFQRAAFRCPDHIGARTGLGFTSLRSGDDSAAARWFDGVISERPAAVDALVGRGILAWRAGDLERVHHYFHTAVELDPSRSDALVYLDSLPEGFGPPPPRPPLVAPDTLEYRSRAFGDHLQLRGDDGAWRNFYVKGVNLGAALPGRYPSEFPDSATYAEWLAQIAAMGANTVRLYTIHSPAFYQAFLDHNRRAERPLWLLHGVWAELPPEHDYSDPAWERAFFAEIRDAVDAVHGRADIRPRPGHASGHYLADVSPWVLGWILGREWEPYSVIAYNEKYPHRSSFRGRYLELDGGNAMDVWLARAVEYLVAYETQSYNVQRPVSYTNWPTLDPLHHVTEATAVEDAAIRRWLGEDIRVAAGGYDDDAVTVDAALVRTTGALPAGYFAAYHIYPYYPDFLVLSPEYDTAASPLGRSNYFGYLQALKEHHAGMPLLVAEYGVPTSLGISHVHPRGWHHGGLDEGDMAAIATRMTWEISMAGMAGGVLFAWIDEWFKTNWLTHEFSLPNERNRLWHNVLDPEQNYGVLAMEPEPRVPGASLEERIRSWRSVRPLYAGENGVRVRAVADEAVLNLLVELDAGVSAEEVLVGFEIASPQAGSFRWPGADAPAIPVGIDFLLRATRAEVRLLANPEANPMRIDPDTVGEALRGRPRPLAIDAEPPGFFQARIRQNTYTARPLVRRDDGRFDPLVVVPNRLRFSRDTTEYLAMAYDRGILPAGPRPDGFWEWLPDGSALEVRIPWALINVTDPSSRRVLRMGAPPAPDGALSTAQVDGIGVVAAVRDAAGWSTLPASGRAADVARFSWPAWDRPRFRSRPRPLFDAMRETFRVMELQLVRTEPIR